MPWLDRKGSFAPLKALTLLLVAAPGLWLLYRTLFLGLGPRPMTVAVHFLGVWTVYLLLASLAISPARRIYDLRQAIQLRRMIGLAALVYLIAHFILYIVDSRWDLVFVATEIVLRIYLAIGFVSVLMLVALGVTSTDSMIRRMGAQRWNRLHMLVYPATFLGILHFFMQSKADVTEPVIMSGLFVWLMGYRIMSRYGKKDGLVPFLSLSVAAALATVAIETAWYGLVTGIGAERIFWANFQFDFRISPAWWVLGAGLFVTLTAEIRRRWTPSRTARPSASTA